MNDQLIITIPNWVVIVVGVWFTLQSIVCCLSIYKSWLEYKISRLRDPRDIYQSDIDELLSDIDKQGDVVIPPDDLDKILKSLGRKK